MKALMRWVSYENKTKNETLPRQEIEEKNQNLTIASK